MLSAGADALAQSSGATLTGRVRTEAGAPVVEAIVQARSTKTGTFRVVVTDGSGRYRFESLRPGDWLVVARLADGVVSESRHVVLHLQQTVTLDFQVGTGLSERVTVTPDTPLIDRSETGASLRIDREKIATLPVGGREFTGLALLDSAVRQSTGEGFSGERGTVFSVNGQSGRSNTFLVDGLDNNDQTSGTSYNSFFSQQVIEEFVLLTTQYAPEFGRASGGILNVVTRQGGNEPSWGAFAQGSAARWNSTPHFVSALPATDPSASAPRWFQAGFRLGGPIKKDRAFYFAAYERRENDDIATYTGVDRTGQRGGRIVAPSRNDHMFVRTDFNVGSSNTLMLRLSVDDRSTENLNVGGISTPEAGFGLDEQDVQIAAAFTAPLSPTLLSETRMLVGASEFDQHANSEATGVTRPSGIFGGNQLSAQRRDERLVQLVQNVTWQRGRHLMKFGVDVLHSRTRIRVKFNPNGSFLYETDRPFEPGDCGNLNTILAGSAAPDGTVSCPGVVGVDDDMDGVIDEPANILTYPLVYTRIQGNADAMQRDTRISLFAQDKWRIGSRWLLDYGLRYDLTTFELPADLRVDSTIPNGGATRDTDNVAPRLGFSWAPRGDGKVVVRGGWGIFYDKLVLAFPAVAAVTAGTEIGFAFPQGFAEEVTEAFVEENGPDALPLFFPEGLTLRFSTAPKLETPYTVQYNIGFEMPVGDNGSFRADVVRARGYHTPLMRDLNPTICVPDVIDTNPECPFLPEHRDPNNGSIAAVTTDGRNWYDGVDLRYRLQRGGSWLNAAYTISKTENLGFDPLKGGIALPPNSDDVSAERGRADGDRRHRVVLSGDFPIPGPLRMSVVASVASGVPFNVVTGTDDNLDGILSERPPGVGRNDGERSSLDAINALRASPEVDLPPVTSLDEPSFSQVDTRLYWMFGVPGKRGGQVFLQVLNLFDTTNVAQIEGRVNSANFGRTIGLTGPPRTFELGLTFSR